METTLVTLNTKQLQGVCYKHSGTKEIKDVREKGERKTPGTGYTAPVN